MLRIDFERNGPSYVVAFTDTAAAEAEAAFLWLLSHVGEAFAARWYAGLFAAAERITEQPEAHPHAPLQPA